MVKIKCGLLLIIIIITEVSKSVVGPIDAFAVVISEEGMRWQVVGGTSGDGV